MRVNREGMHGLIRVLTPLLEAKKIRRIQKGAGDEKPKKGDGVEKEGPVRQGKTKGVAL